MFTFQELYTAYKQCRLKKRPSSDQIRFDQKIVENLSKLLQELNEGIYKVSPYRCFVVLHPKPREIFAASFRDRIVHHLIVSRLTPEWERRFYHGSFACRKTRGTHGAMKYLMKKHQEISRGGKEEVFFLQMDLAAFFVTIDREILFNLIAKEIKDEIFLNVLKVNILNDPTENVILKSGKEYLDLILPHKTLFKRSNGEGIPIGNLTSQFGANVYLNGLDHFISRRLRPKAYLCYMDDLLLLDTDKDKLVEMIGKISLWIKNERKQEINPDKTILGSFRKDKMDYLGHLFKEKSGQLYCYPQSAKRYKVVSSAKAVYGSFGLSTNYAGTSLERKKESYNKFLASFRAHLGNLKHSRSYLFRKKTIDKLNDDLLTKAHFLGIKRDKIKI